VWFYRWNRKTAVAVSILSIWFSCGFGTAVVGLLQNLIQMVAEQRWNQFFFTTANPVELTKKNCITKSVKSFKANTMKEPLTQVGGVRGARSDIFLLLERPLWSYFAAVEYPVFTIWMHTADRIAGEDVDYLWPERVKVEHVVLIKTHLHWYNIPAPQSTHTHWGNSWLSRRLKIA
jgi:hypothetical protein